MLADGRARAEIRKDVSRLLTNQIRKPGLERKVVTEARRDETRQRRLTQAIEMLAEGKTRNCQYS